MILLRLIHILCGVFWAGTLIFVVTFLEPSVRAAGPEGARVMQALLRRHYLNIMPVIAALTILSGLDLLRRVSGGFHPSWFGSAPGLTLTAGSVVSVIAFAIGVFVMRPATLRIGGLMAEAAAAPEGPPRDAIVARAQALRRRSSLAARWVASLLAIAVVTMAIARYLG